LTRALRAQFGPRCILNPGLMGDAAPAASAAKVTS
jgi:hypothetical protein